LNYLCTHDFENNAAKAYDSKIKIPDSAKKKAGPHVIGNKPHIDDTEDYLKDDDFENYDEDLDDSVESEADIKYEFSMRDGY
jgi:hypothetical protein